MTELHTNLVVVTVVDVDASTAAFLRRVVIDMLLGWDSFLFSIVSARRVACRSSTTTPTQIHDADARILGKAKVTKGFYRTV
jgi:hypothetical protein